MDCRHERLECTNNVLRCMVCGAVLPLEVLRGAPSSVSREAAATFPAGEGFGDDGATAAEGMADTSSGAGAPPSPQGEGFEDAGATAAGEGFGDESRESAEPAKPRRGRKGK